MATTTITTQIITGVGGLNRQVPTTTATITHSGTGFAEGIMPTSDTAAVIPQGGVTVVQAFFQNLSSVAGEYIDIMNDTAVLTRIQPGMHACLDVSQVSTPASNLKAKAASGKTPNLAYFFVSA